jgi:hypothetical protein
MTKIVVDNGPTWFQYLVGFATAAAALFAGWAAFAARSSARATNAMVKLETRRDVRARETALWRQARSVTVEAAARHCEAPAATDVHVQIFNDGREPIRKSRLRVDLNREPRWGPQLLGTIPAGHTATLTVRIYGDDFDPNALLRFADAQGNYWVTDAQGALEQDDRPTDEWIAEGRRWAEGGQELGQEERGTVTGISLPDFDAWLASVDDDQR